MLNKKRLEDPIVIGGWPLISIYINPPQLGSNGIHCVEFPHEVRKLLDFVLGEPLALVEEFPCLDNLIKLDLMLASSLDLCVHYVFGGCLFHVVRVEIYWCQLFRDLIGIQ
jgi:hypothetical protein